MPLSIEQFKKLDAEGFTPEEIASFEQRKTTEKSSKQSLWSKFGAAITPEMEQTSPYLSALAKTGQDVSAASAHFLNQFLLNLPQAVAHKAGVEYPEAETTAGQILSKGAGVAGAIVSPVGKAIIGLANLPAGAKLGTKLLQGAKVGAIGGAAYTPTENIIGLPQRAVQAAGGAVLSAGLTGISEEIQEGVKAYRQWKTPAKPSITARMGWQKADVRRRASERIRELQQTNTEVQNVMVDNIKQLDTELTKASQIGAIDIQERLPQFFRANSESYGQRLNDISDDLVERGQEIWRGQVVEVLDKTIAEADAEGLVSGATRSLVDNLKYKYRIDPEKRLFIDNPVDFKEFNQDLRNIFNLTFKQFEKGKVRFESDDIISAILKKNYGEFIQNFVPDFARLQEAYKPVVQAMKVAGKAFKPYGNKFSNIPGENLLRRAGTGKATKQEMALIELMEQGSEFSEGLGNITGSTKALGKQLTEGKVQLDTLKRMLKTTTQETKAKIQPRIDQLTERQRKVATILANKERARVVKKVIFGASGLGLTGLGAYLFHRKITDWLTGQ